MNTSHSSPKSWQASASAEPHWPAPVSVASLRDPGLLVVEGLRDRGVRLVRAGRGDPLVLVVDVGGGIERLLEPPGAQQRRRPPERVDLAHLLGDLDLRARPRPPARSAPSGTAAPGPRGRAAPWSRDEAAAAARPGRSGEQVDPVGRDRGRGQAKVDAGAHGISSRKWRGDSMIARRWRAGSQIEEPRSRSSRPASAPVSTPRSTRRSRPCGRTARRGSAGSRPRFSTGTSGSARCRGR